MEYGIIDIGSNSIRYAQGSVKSGRAELSGKRLITTRLAEGLISTGELSQAAMERSAAAISEFVTVAGSIPVFAYATSAVRDAKNRCEFLSFIKERCGVEIEVLSGDDEAKYAFVGAASGHRGLIDIGGGSAQAITKDYALSFPMGCVRAREYAEGAETLEKIRQKIHARCAELMTLPVENCTFAGVGGSITTLAALDLELEVYSRAAVSGHELTPARISGLIDELYLMGDKRAQHPLLLQRHDVIIHGALICEYMLDKMKIPRLVVADRDGMEGYLEAKLSL